MKRKTALITGITGQDGAYLAKFLLEKNYQVFGTYRRLSTPNFWRLKYLNIENDITYLSADLFDLSSMLEAIKTSQPDEIYHLAAQSYVGASFEQPITSGEYTGIAVTKMLEAIRIINPQIKFYQASSSEMFGNEPGVKNEQTYLKPRSPYGAAKVFAHHITNHYKEAYDIFACCGILFNHESPLRGLEFVTRKITYELAQIKYKKQKKFSLGNIYAKRDWGFAGDYVEAMWLMLQQKNPDDYVIATGESHSVEEFLTLATEFMGLGKWEDLVNIDKDLMRPTDIEDLIGDASKAKKELGWTPKTNFKDLVKSMVEHDSEQVKSTIK